MKKELLDSYNPKSVDEIYKIMGEMFGKNKAQLSTVVAHSFDFIKQNIRHGNHPSVMLHNLGSFETYLTIVNKKINLYIAAYKRGLLTKVKFERKFRTLWKLRQATIKTCEHKKKNGIKKEELD